jgi:Holliday junction resolvase
MGASSRRKGVDAEREVAALWQTAGFQVRALEGMGDHLVMAPKSTNAKLPIHCEVKRQERVRLPEWARQAEAEAPQGTIAVVAWRQNNGVWRADLRLDALVELAS